MNVEHILASKGREVKTIRPNVSIAEALRRLRAEGIGSLVVSENGTNLAGILSDRDILNAIADHGIDILGESRAGSVCLNRLSGLIGGASAGLRPPRSAAAG
jgi:CBS domain-containing protein